MLNMDSFFQKFALPIIKSEDLSEAIDISPKNTVIEWDLEVTEKFVKHTFFTNDKELDTALKTYVLSLRNRAVHLKDKPLLKEKILNHMNILHLCFKGKEQSFVPEKNYCQYMEEILTVFCNLELAVARHLRRSEMPTKDYNQQISLVSKRMCKILNVFLENKKHIMHVLLKLTFRPNIHSHQYIMRLVFMHFLMKSPLENLSDEAFCRYYLAFERYKEVSTEDCRSKMNEALFLRFQKKPDFLQTSDIMRKVLAPTNFSVNGILNHLIDYKSHTVQAYFDYIKKQKSEELPNVTNMLNLHHNEEQNKDESNFASIYNDIVRSFTNKPSHSELQIKEEEEECIELDSDSDVAVTSDGLVQLILGDSDDEICEIAFMESSINYKHKSRKKRKHLDEYPIVSYIDLDSDIPTSSSSCQELTQTSTPTTTIASISTSVQSLSLSTQSVMSVCRSQQTSPLKESDGSVCESMLCENSNACSDKYPTKEYKSPVEERRRATFKAVEIQTDPIMPTSNRLKKESKVIESRTSERTTYYANRKSVGVDPMQQENESGKENHLHENKPMRIDGQLNHSKSFRSVAFNNSVINRRNVMDSEVECIDLVTDNSNVVASVQTDIRKKKLTAEVATDTEYLNQTKESISQPSATEKTSLSLYSQVPKVSLSTSSSQSQSVKTVSRSQQTSQDAENNNNARQEIFIDITNESSSSCNEEERLNFRACETQTAKITRSNQFDDVVVKIEKPDAFTSSNSTRDSLRREEENRRCKVGFTMDEYDDEIRRTNRITFGDYKPVDSEVQCVDRFAGKNREEFITVRTERADDFPREKVADASPKRSCGITDTATNTEMQSAREMENSVGNNVIGSVDDENASSPEVELIEIDPEKPINSSEDKKGNALPKQNDPPIAAESERNTSQNNQEQNDDVSQAIRDNLLVDVQNSMCVTEERLENISSAITSANEEISPPEVVTSEPQPATENIIGGSKEKEFAVVLDQENVKTPGVSVDDHPNKNSAESLCGANSNDGQLQTRQHVHGEDSSEENACVKDAEPQSSLEIVCDSHEISFEEEETVIQPVISAENPQCRLNYETPNGGATESVNRTDDEQSPSSEKKSTENVTPEVQKFDELKRTDSSRKNKIIKKKSIRVKHKSNINAVNYKDYNGLRRDVYNNANNERRTAAKRRLRNSQAKRSIRRKRAEEKVKMLSDAKSSADEKEGAPEAGVSSKIQPKDVFIQSKIAINETATPQNSAEQNLTAEKSSVRLSTPDEIIRPAASEVTWLVLNQNVSNININTPNYVICNFIIQNPVTEAATSGENNTNVTEIANKTDNTENLSHCDKAVEQEVDDDAIMTIKSAEQLPSEANEVPADVSLEVENVIGGGESSEVIGEKSDDNENRNERDIIITREESADKSNDDGPLKDEDANKTTKTVYTCESVKEIPLEVFSQMEKKFNHLLNSSERDEFEDVFSGPVTKLNKNSSNSLYYENSNGFKFDLFSFAKSQPMFSSSNLDEKDFALDNNKEGNSPASSRSGSPTVSPEYEVFDFSDLRDFMEQSHSQKKTKKYKAKQQEIEQDNKPRPVKRCKFSDTVKTRIIDSDSEYSDHLVPMDSLKGVVGFEPRCENVTWNGVKCFVDPRDEKLFSDASVQLNRISDKELAYRIYRPHMEKFVYQETETCKKPRHNTSRSCIQQKLDFNKDSNGSSSHRTEAYARLGIGNFTSSNYPTEDYTPLGVGGLNSSNYVPTTRISNKGMVDITNLVPPTNNEFHNDNISVNAQPHSDKIIYSDTLNLSVPCKEKGPELHSEFSNSPKFLSDSEQLVRDCMAKTFDEPHEITGSQSDVLLLSDHSNFYMETAGNDQILNVLPNNLMFTQDLSGFDPNEQEEIDVVGVCQSEHVDDADDISDLMIFKNAATPNIEQITHEVPPQIDNGDDLIINNELNAPNVDCKNKERNDLPNKQHGANYTAEDLYNYVLNDKVHVASMPLDDYNKTTNANCMMNLDGSNSVNQRPQYMVDNFNYLSDNLHAACGIYNAQLLDQAGVIYSHAPPMPPMITKENQALLNKVNAPPKQSNQTRSEKQADDKMMKTSPKARARETNNNPPAVRGKRGRPRLGTRKRTAGKNFSEDCAGNIYLNDKYNKPVKNAETCYNAAYNACAMNLNMFKTHAEAPGNNYDNMSGKTYARDRLMGSSIEKLPPSQKLFNPGEGYCKPPYSFNAAKTYSQERPLNNYNMAKGAGDDKFYPSHKLNNTYHLNSCDKLPYLGSYEHPPDRYNIAGNGPEKRYKDTLDMSRALNYAHEHQNSVDIDNNLLSSVTEVSNSNKEYIKLLSTFIPRESLNYDAFKGENSAGHFYDLSKYNNGRGGAKQFEGAGLDMSSNNCKGYEPFPPNQAFDMQKGYVAPPSSGVIPVNMNFENMNLTARKHAASDLTKLNMGMYAQAPNQLGEAGLTRTYNNKCEAIKNPLSEVKRKNSYETTPGNPPVNTHGSVKYLNELHALHARKAGEKLAPRKRKCEESGGAAEKLAEKQRKDDNNVVVSELSPNSSSIEDDHEFNEEEINAFLRLLNNGSETSLPFKKRRRSVKQGINNYMAQEEEISYPATPMISIAEIEALQSKSTTVRPFKTPAERKEMPPLPPTAAADDSAASPIISEQININNHTFINPIINCHMHATTTFLQLPVYHPVNNQMFLKVNSQNVKSNGNGSLESQNLNKGAVANE